MVASYSKMCIYVLFLITFSMLDQVFSENDVNLTLKQGEIKGQIEETFFKKQQYYSFRGVPYAEPPVADLRFKPPKPLKEWSGVYEAKTNKPTCLQNGFRGRMKEEFGISGSEDCLYLSVFTPSVDGTYPVVVFDYNDNFRTGFNGTDIYSPDFFIEEGIIVVMINHRLGLFGYLTTEDNSIPPNNGVNDFIFGLEWIRDNIEKFGGDPNRVTLMGSRGGSALVNLLLYTSKAKGLFTNVIMQGGSAMETAYFYENPRNIAFKLGKMLNIETTDSLKLLEELQKLTAINILDQETKILDETSNEDNKYPFAPTVERDNVNALLTVLPENAQIVNDVPVLIGFNSRDGLDLVSYLILVPHLLAEMETKKLYFKFPVRTGFTFERNSSIYDNAIEEIKNFYLDGVNLTHTNILEYSMYFGDIFQNYAIDITARKLSAALKSPVYYYMFDFRGSLNENSEYLARFAPISLKYSGGTVLDELCYLHLCNRIKKTYSKLTKLVSEQAEIKVLKKMVRLWTNFIKMGNPTPNPKDDVLKNISWNAMDKGSLEKNYLHITKQPKMSTNPMNGRDKFWDDFLEKYSQISIDGLVSERAREEL